MIFDQALWREYGLRGEMIHNKLHHGYEYEEKAAQHLRQQGYEILARNVRFKCGEIDIVAQKNQTLVFVEVRKGDHSQWLRPEETITTGKRLKLLNAVRWFLSRYAGSAKEMRIDFIGFRAKKNAEAELRHFENFIQA